jgi:ribosome maturation factor RimP
MGRVGSQGVGLWPTFFFRAKGRLMAVTSTDALAVVRAICESIVAKRALELVEVRLGAGTGGRTLTLTVDRVESPVTLGEIADLSEEISRALDNDDPIEGRYTLEVSSAGIERPLVKPSDYQRFTGREITVRCLEPIQGRRNFKGRIQSAGAETFVLASEDGFMVEIPYGQVGRAKLVVDWDAELKGLNRGAP